MEPSVLTREIYSQSSEPHNADAMWVEPATMNLTAIGQTFNVTIWVNITEDVFGWSVGLLYNRTYLECTAAKYSAGATSELFAGHSTAAAPLIIDTSYLGNGSVLATESLLDDDFISGPCNGTLMNATFQVVSIPAANQTLTFDITSTYPSDTWVDDPSLTSLTLTTYDAYYTIVPPPGWTLTVFSAHDSPSPSVGDHVYANDSSVTCNVTSPVVEAGVSYTCTGWTGTGSVPPSGSGLSTTFTITQNSTITWNWIVTPVVTQFQVTFDQSGVGSDFTGTIVIIDGINYSRSQLPISFTWTNESSHTFAYQSPLSPNANTRYVWNSTTGLTSLQSGSVTVTTNGSIIGNYKTQYYLTVTSAYDSPTPLSGWFDSGTGINESVTSPVSGGSGTQYVCTGWTGSGCVPASGSAFSVVFTINQPSSITWNWKTQYYLTVNSAYDTPGGAGWYDSGSVAYATLSSGTVSGGSGVQYVFTGWSGDASGSGLTSNGIIMNAPKTATANWKTQYYLTVSSAYGSTDGQGWYDSGSTAYATLAPLTVAGASGVQYVFTQWSGDASGSTSPSNAITMSGPKTATADWKTQYYFTVSSAYDSPTPLSGWFDSGTEITANVTSPSAGPSGTQHVCTGWSGTGSVPASGSSTTVTFFITQPSNITWNWKTQYYLTVSSAHGTVDGQGWYDSGSTAYATVSPLTVAGSSGTQYVFTMWSGDASGSTSPSSAIVMSGPKTATANWKTQYYLTVSSAYDSPTPTSGWFDSGTGINESVTSPASGPSGTQYVCTGWIGSGSVPSGGLETSVFFILSQPSSITWNWKTQCRVTFNESGVGSGFTATVVTVDSVNYSLIGLPVSFWWDNGSSHSFSFASPLAVSITQCFWNSTSGLSTLQAGTLTVKGPGSVVGNYVAASLVQVLLLLPPWLVLASAVGLGLLSVSVLLVFLEINWITNSRKTKKGKRRH
jgi:hypothetical protein